MAAEQEFRAIIYYGNGIFYAPSGDNKLYALDEITGATLYRAGAACTAEPVHPPVRSVSDGYSEVNAEQTSGPISLPLGSNDGKIQIRVLVVRSGLNRCFYRVGAGERLNHFDERTGRRMSNVATLQIVFPKDLLALLGAQPQIF